MAGSVIFCKPPAREPAELALINGWWRAANYLAVGQIYLYDNPLSREKLSLTHIKPLIVGHWGTTPGAELYIHIFESYHKKM